MNSSEFSKLIELVKLDKELYQSFTEKTDLTSRLEDIEIEIENIQKDIESIHKELTDLNKLVYSLEKDLKALDDQEIKKNKQINQASTTREYYSLTHELEDLTKQKDDIENKLFNLLNQIQKLEITYQDAILQAKLKKENLTKDIYSFQLRLSDLDKQIVLINNNKEKLESQLISIVPEFLEQYKLMKQVVINPIVKLKDSHCSACFNQLTLHEISMIKDKNLVKCQNCYRFVYLSDLDLNN